MHSFSFKFNVCNGILFGWCFNPAFIAVCRVAATIK